MITSVVCGIGINVTLDGTKVIGITTGDGGKLWIDGISRVTITVGLIGLGTGTMNVVGTVGGTE
jgi:hypothetical protein